MQAQVRSAGCSFRRYLWRIQPGVGISDTLGKKATEVIQEKDHVLRPIPIIETESNLWNMKTFVASVMLISTTDGHFVDDMLLYGIILNMMQCNEGWFCISEVNKDGVFHVHCMAKASPRVDSWKRTLLTVWKNIQNHPSIIERFGECTLDCIKCQRAHRPTALMTYMCKNPCWVLSDKDMYLQMAYDISCWGLAERFQNKEKNKPDMDQANPMVKEILEAIMERSIKTLEEFMKHYPEIAVKYLHRPSFGTIVQNCITYAKTTGRAWQIGNFSKYNPDPSAIHAIILTQGIPPSVWDWTFYKWITKYDRKRNTICVTGPSNTGKTSIIAGLKKVCPNGEIVNGQNFNFEGLVECYWGTWDEPLCGPETAEKFKQIAGGEPCAVPVKFKKPVILPRIPIYICTNTPFWYWCPQQQTMFKNRFFEFEFKYDVSNGAFIPRCIETSCGCRACQFSRRGEDSASCSTSTRSMQESEQSGITGQQLDSGNESSKSSMGTRSMPTGTSSFRQSEQTECSGGESGSDSGSRGSSSSTASNRLGSNTTDRSSNPRKRVHSARTRSSKSILASNRRGTERPILSSDGGNTIRSGNDRTICGSNNECSEVLSPMVSVGGTGSTSAEVETEIQTKQPRLDREVVSLTIPDRDEWCCYLSYLHSRYNVTKPSLYCSESLLPSGSDSE